MTAMDPAAPLLIPALSDIQERHGYLPAAELEFLALRTGLPLYRVQEIVTFFPHFRKEPAPPVTVHVCRSMTCHLRGAASLLASSQERFRDQIARKELAVDGVSCLGRCDRAPVAFVSRHGAHSDSDFHHALQVHLDRPTSRLEELIEAVLAGATPAPHHDRSVPATTPPWQIDVYRAEQPADALAPFAAARRVLENDDPPAVIKVLKAAGLVGMGGAAARTWKKWQDVRDARGDTKYVVCNGDESEPGTFKDRELLLRTPHLVVEGLLVAALTVGAARGYIYIRHEYPEQIEAVRQTLRALEAAVPEAVARCPLEVFTSPGAYICGEESALLEVIEGRRAQPRNTPPEIRSNGLFQKPTLVNNVETLAWVPALLLRTPESWYQEQPLRFFSLSGDVRRPGVYEVPIRTTLRTLVTDYAGGLEEGLELFALASSGPSGGFLPGRLDAGPLRQALARNLPALRERTPGEANRVEAFCQRALPDTAATLDLLDLELDVALFRALDLALGAGLVVYGGRPGKRTIMLGHVRNCLEFFARESCGKCVPCRLGTEQLVEMAGGFGEAPRASGSTEATARSLAQVMEQTSICGLGRVAANPLITYLDYFCHELPRTSAEDRP
jgi:NADH:ubiquinone oxidoreductase subunit F (NADH-binding)/NADH:ubiquinone oxidoreductase subunit E